MIAKNKKNKRRYDWSAIFSFILIGVLFLGMIGFLLVANLKIGPRRVELRKKIEELKKETQILQEKNEQLKAGLEKAESDVYWEALLREQGYVKPGEQTIVIYPEEKKQEEVQEEKKVWENWREILDRFWENWQ